MFYRDTRLRNGNRHRLYTYCLVLPLLVCGSLKESQPASMEVAKRGHIISNDKAWIENSQDFDS
jgi:hypothetical protein